MTATETPTTSAEALVRSRIDALLAAHDPRTTPAEEFLGAQFDAGLAWVWFPEGCGGLGLSPAYQDLVEERLSAAGAPRLMARNPISGMAAPTVATHGSDEQRARYLRPMFTCEEIWCQLFSEPGAGSDVASLATRAVRDGDEWVVNGQKVWTTMAHTARFGLLVARTDPELPKHRGMTYFVIDMKAPGVEVRPLRQMTGEAEFNEVYMTDVRIPDAERLGEVGDGWRVAMTTLMNERVAIGGSVAPRGSGPIGDLVRLWKDAPRKDPALRDEVMRLWVAAEVGRLTNLRAQQAREVGTPGPEGSIAKLAFAELNKRIYEACLAVMGPEGMLYGSYDMVRPEVAGGWGDGNVAKAFLRVRANSIEGGTSEIMRNILGERVLGLPGEPRVDKELPWSQVPRS
ncbi:MAG TPA: acyl-CoA dehydrogenase family protein [Acidimicrobiales bacterium]|nr:acyl-CoA dehydrogenase family protein [Acidimicrobiales bacterium]